jgi:hypothetical protein
MGLLDFLKPKTKGINRNLFAFLLANTPPDVLGPERRAAYKGWFYACVNAIAEEVSTIELKLQQRTGDAWKEVEDPIALGPLTTVNRFMKFSELIFAPQGFLELSGEAHPELIPHAPSPSIQQRINPLIPKVLVVERAEVGRAVALPG